MRETTIPGVLVRPHIAHNESLHCRKPASPFHICRIQSNEYHYAHADRNTKTEKGIPMTALYVRPYVKEYSNEITKPGQ